MRFMNNTVEFGKKAASRRAGFNPFLGNGGDKAIYCLAAKGATLLTNRYIE
jgi:hypothetical protein